MARRLARMLQARQYFIYLADHFASPDHVAEALKDFAVRGIDGVILESDDAIAASRDVQQAVETFNVEPPSGVSTMQIDVSPSKQELGRRAAEHGADLIREAIEQRGEANIIVATGASQFEMLEHLAKADLPWHKITAFHLDEYVGMPVTHPASFRLYLWQRFVSRLPLPLKAFHYLDTEADAKGEAQRVGSLIRTCPIDVAFVGIGENGHMAFNDPPADFETDEPYIIVNLDEACRRQQHGEGWFPTFDDVPTEAVSMSIRQILKSRSIIVSVPDKRKARAVRESLENDISPQHPSTCLQQHERVWLYLDKESASESSAAAAS